jgi:hypothetical protein
MPHVGLKESVIVDYLSRIVEKIGALVQLEDAMWFIGAMALFLLSDIFEHFYRRRSGKRRKS